MGLQGARYLTLPTLTFVYQHDHEGGTAKLDLIVHGVRCYGTANFLRQHIADVPGIISLVAYGANHRVVIVYDSTLTSAEEIKRAIESPVKTRRGAVRFFKVRSQAATSQSG